MLVDNSLEWTKEYAFFRKPRPPLVMQQDVGYTLKREQYVLAAAGKQTLGLQKAQC